ncbi:MAG: DUF2332 domain-containing protein [Gammaproteobacteria bacterium]
MQATAMGAGTGTAAVSAARDFADSIERFDTYGCTLYRELARRALADAELIALADRTRPGQFPAFMLFTAVQYLLMGDPGHRLARWFASLNDPPAPAADAYDPFRSYCLANRAPIEALIGTCTLQSTMPGRISYLLPAVAHVCAAAAAPLSLVEIGCSAGVTTLFDHMACDYGDGQRLGAADAPLTVRAQLGAGSMPLPVAPVRIARRWGIELEPVEITDPSACRWLLAQLPPEPRVDQEELAAALQVRRAHPFPILAGDALELLPGLAAAIEGPLLVLHSQALYQWPEQVREALDRILADLGAARTVHRLGVERNPIAPARVRAHVQGRFPPDQSVIVHSVYDSGPPRHAYLGEVDGRGKWLRWTVEPLSP